MLNKKTVVLSAWMITVLSLSSPALADTVIRLRDAGIQPPQTQAGPWVIPSENTRVKPDQYNSAAALQGVLPQPYPDPAKGMDMEISGEPRHAEKKESEAVVPHAVTNEEIIEYYQNAVIVGDSVAYGLQLYAARNTSDPLFSALRFLTAGSFSVHNAFWPVSEKSVHPMIQGAQHPVWESIPMTGRKHVFTFFGLNDMNAGKDTPEKYVQLLQKIKASDPEVDFTIISCTYTLADKSSGRLNNTEIRDFNAKMQELAQQNGWGYLDMATPLSDGAGNLAPVYCSDGFVHQTRAAYAVWREQLVAYAYRQLSQG
jgi:hypothetical protein